MAVVEALSELRDLLGTLRSSPGSGKASLKPLPPGNQQELALALADLLVRAAEQDRDAMPKGGANEPQTHD